MVLLLYHRLPFHQNVGAEDAHGYDDDKYDWYYALHLVPYERDFPNTPKQKQFLLIEWWVCHPNKRIVCEGACVVACENSTVMTEEIKPMLSVIRSDPGRANSAEWLVVIRCLFDQVIDPTCAGWHRVHYFSLFFRRPTENVECQRMFCLRRVVVIDKLNSFIDGRDSNYDKNGTEDFLFHDGRICSSLNNCRCNESFLYIVKLAPVNNFARSINEVNNSFGMLYSYHFPNVSCIITTVAVARYGVHSIHGTEQFIGKFFLYTLFYQYLRGGTKANAVQNKVEQEVDLTQQT